MTFFIITDGQLGYDSWLLFKCGPDDELPGCEEIKSDSGSWERITWLWQRRWTNRVKFNFPEPGDYIVRYLGIGAIPEFRYWYIKVVENPFEVTENNTDFQFEAEEWIQRIEESWDVLVEDESMEENENK